MTIIELARKLRPLIEKAAQGLTDEDALEAVELYPMWHIGAECTIDERMRYSGRLYRVVQTHTAQAGWEPDKTPALFAEVAEPGTIPVWRQPTGAQDAYAKGDRVHYPDEQGAIWTSNVDANVWEPGVYGWTAEARSRRSDDA